ncbi:hypothetical protein ABUE34_03290 [Kozakia baliensis]|uniref:hypothetical protein n=1 Tax=Kozakia baliensis TaxID=153496 RepID=UPI00345C3559
MPPFKTALAASLATALFAACTPVARADGTSQTKASHAVIASNGTINVHGLSEEEIRHSVEQLTATPWYKQLSRWDTSLCPLIVGLPEPFKGIVFDHIQRTATMVMGTRPKHCTKNNAIIAVTQDGTQTFDEIYKRMPALGQGFDSLGYFKSDQTTPDKYDVSLLREPRPVRWYRGVTTDLADGVVGRMINLSNGRRVASIVSYGDRGILTQKDTISRTSSLILIVDLPRAAGPTWGQLADYIAFVTLASPGLGETFSRTSIMSLFNGGHFQSTAPTRLTNFDIAMLKSLYKADNDVEAHDEQAQIAHDVTHALARQE